MDSESNNPADQYKCTEAVVKTSPNAAIVSNLGTTSYTLIDVKDRDRNFYMNGAMGLTTSIGFGLALSIDDPVVVLEGDGSLLMSLGVLSTVGNYNPPNLTIVVYDNGTYETTGGQDNLSESVDFAAIAEDCGVEAWHATSTSEFINSYEEAVDYEGAALVSCEIGAFTLEDYPTLDYAHSHIKHRFRQALTK